MNKHSIIRLITIFFVLTFVLINGLFFIAHQHLSKQHEMEQIRRFLLADKLLHDYKHEFTQELEQLMIKKSSLKPEDVKANSKIIIELPFGDIITSNSHTFFVSRQPPPPPHDMNFEKDRFLPPPPPHDMNHFPKIVLEDIQPYSIAKFWLILASVDVLVLLFFIYIIKKLFPLHRLKNAIIAFKEGDSHLDVPISGEDEISQITHEFNTTLNKLTSMREARSLFLRNILHELKTPIMKGSLTTECLEESEEQERLKRIFFRMDFLLNEFAKMEHFNSGEWELDLQEYRFVDLLDHTCDMLLCDKNALDIKGEDSELIINVDFKLFTIVLKNLLDNAFRYSNEKPHLQINKDSIDICSYGEELPKEKQDFSKSFNRDFENSSAGLGLGLYLSDSILKKHGFKLHYCYQNGLNCFSIIL